jgi:hypothetical protein
MRKSLLAMLLLAPLLAAQAFAQSGAVVPEGGAGHAGSSSCVILKRMGPADQVTSHLYSFGIRGSSSSMSRASCPTDSLFTAG